MLLWSVYLLGVVTALAVMRDRWPVRLGTALVWPLGPAAFAVVVTVLLVSSVILWPLLMLPIAALGALTWWLA